MTPSDAGVERNPFTPGFGQSPAILAGRTGILGDVEAVLDGELPEMRALLISGARGIGKTVLLSEIEARARDRGWVQLALHTGASSMAEELRQGAVAQLRELDPDAVSSKLTGAGLSGVSASRAVTDRYGHEPEALGALLDRVAELATEQGSGVLITLDEVQSVDRDQLHEIAQLIQDLTRRGRETMVAAAGVRVGVDRLLEHEKTTFLRRAHRVELGRVDVGTAAEAIRMTVADTSRTIAPEAAVLAAEISEGYPYLIQLAGSKAWRSAAGAESIEVEDVESGRAAVVAEMIKNVHGPALRELSQRKEDYLAAMLEDGDGPSNVGDIAKRMGVDPRYQSTYRERLIADELIEPAGRGYVRFALPYLREAIEERLSGGSLTTHDQGIDRSRSAPQVTRSRSAARREGGER